MKFADEARSIPLRVSVILKAAALGLFFLAGVWPQFATSWQDALRYRDGGPGEYGSVVTWLDSARCARQTGAWAAHCESDGMTPLLADDPGHATILGYWAIFADRDVTVVDAARLNLMINFAGLIVLVATMLALGRFWTALVVLWLGPPVFLEWFGAAPHWSFIGVLAMQLALPAGIIARATRSVPAVTSIALIVFGLLFLAFAALIREPIGWMSLFVSLAALAAMAFLARQGRSDLLMLSAVGLLAVVASQTAQISMAVRDAMYEMDTSHAVATHGISHNLYVGLGAVENRFGLTYDDEVALAAAKQAVPGTKDYSKEYFRIIRRLYWAKVVEDPLEVVRIYFEKTKLFLAQRIIDLAPALWIFLVLTLGLQAIVWPLRLRGGAGHAAVLRLAINAVCTAFIAFFVLQGVLANPSRFFAAPAGACMIVMIGIAAEHLATLAGLALRMVLRSPR